MSEPEVFGLVVLDLTVGIEKYRESSSKSSQLIFRPCVNTLIFNFKLLLIFQYKSEPIALKEIHGLSVIQCIMFQRLAESDF